MSRLLKHIHDHTIAQPQAIAVVGPQDSVSYAELSEQVDATACWLRAHKVRALGLHCSNSVDWIATDLAAVQLGIPIIPIPGFFTEQQVAHLITDSGIDAVLADDQQSYEFETDRTAHISNQGLSLRRLPGSGTHENPKYAKVTYTSGSTGSPKGVCLSQATIESVVEALSDRLIDTKMERHLCMLPFATLLENIAGVYLALWNGASVIVDSPSEFGLLSNSEFSAQHFTAAVKQHQINSAILLPQMLKAIVENSGLEKAGSGKAENNGLASLSFLAVGGGKTPESVIAHANCIGLPVFEGYGLSETASVLCINTPSHNRTGSVGQLLGHAKVHLAKDKEMIVSNPIMEGYLHDSETPENIATGDIGHIDEDGYVYISGRKKNCLISGFGRNISPEWVESHLLGEAEISQIVVFGEAESHLSAVVVSALNYDCINLQTLIRKRNESLPDYAQIKKWVLADAPFKSENGLLTANGKPKRDAIFAHYKQSLTEGAQLA
ncbi:MAG: AMP-binding protein [Pseudomonadales bacterium]